MTLSRREILTGAAGTAVGLAGIGAHPAVGSDAPQKKLAKNQIPFGAAVRGEPLLLDDAYRRALLKYCSIVVPEGALKWIETRPTPDRFDFAKADVIIDFAKANGIEPRGHTLVWYEALPPWTKQISSTGNAERALRFHIEQLVGRYRGVIRSWDVINEPIAEDEIGTENLRPSVWTSTLGERYIEIALRTAAATDPDAQLVINENDLAVSGAKYETRRVAFLQLLRRLKDKDVPLHAVGIQGHLRSDWQQDRDGFQRLLEGIKRLNLDILITEMDVIDQSLPGPETVRDILVAKLVYDFLQTVFEVIRPKSILTWGISDRYTWVPLWFKREDQLANRPLPLDDQMRPKPLLAVIDHFCTSPI